MTIDSDSARFSQALRSAVLRPVGIILLTALLLLLLVFELFEQIRWSEHSYQVLVQTQICKNLVVATQNDVRGYLLTGNDDFLQDYNSAYSQIDEAFNHLKSLVQDNPGQVSGADDLIQAKNTWIEHAGIMISHRGQNLPVNSDWVRMGKTLLDDLETKFKRFTQVEERLRVQRSNSVQRMSDILVYGGGVLAVLLALTVASLVRKQMMALAASYRGALATVEQRHAALVRSEGDLEEQKEWLRVTLTSIGDGVIVTDPAGRVVLMNHESERLTGWTKVDALHQPLSTIFKIVQERTRLPADDLVGRILVEKRTIGLANHTLLLSRTGEEWPIEDSGAPICDAKGNILGVVIVFHDATETRLAQKNLEIHSVELEKKVTERTTTLQQAFAELEAFSYTVSHDLRSPLRAMQGFSEAILEDYGDKLDARGRDYLDRIKKAAGRLDTLIQDLLAYTRISRQETPLEILDLNKIVREVVERDSKLSPPAADVRIEGTFPPVLGRESALNQVLFNLLDNAAKFVAPGVVPQIRICGEDHDSRFRLWVQDNGIGIAFKDHQRIFDMFVQVNDSQLYGGTGVGLAIVKKAMQTMRGSIGLESKDGSGSSFWLELNKAP